MILLQVLVFVCLGLSVVSGQCTTYTYVHTNDSALTHFNEPLSCQTFVNISFNSIQSINNNTFINVFQLRDLDMSHNRLEHLEEGLFTRVRTLQNLNISHNSLKALPFDFFKNKFSLHYVDLSYNLITYINSTVFNYSLRTVREINLQHNLLTTVEPWTMIYSITEPIKYLDLRFNNISKMTNEFNFKYANRSIYDETLVDLRNNSFRVWDDNFLLQYATGNRQVGSVMVEVMFDMRNNDLLCDCNVHNLVKSVSDSFYKYSNSSFLIDILCYDPPNLRGERLFYDVVPRKFVCNLTEGCPDSCLCQDIPDDKIINVDCRNRGLVKMPEITMQNQYNRLALQLDNNNITTVQNKSYTNILTNFKISNNALQHVSRLAIKDIAGINHAEVDFRNNYLTKIPEEIQSIPFQNARLEENQLKCTCDMLWMVDWINLTPIQYNHRKNLSCTFEGKTYKITEIDEGLLKCNPVGNMVLIIVLTVVLFIVIGLIVTAKRCPYETKVLLYKFFRIHPADKYAVDSCGDKTYDMYVSFDDNDTYISQWVRHELVKKLEEQKPFYKLGIGIRDLGVGSEADARLEIMENSKRTMIILSSGYDENEWCQFEVAQSETLDQNAGRVLYMLYYNDSEEMVTKEPWKSRIKDRKVFTIDEKMLWDKLRYELPRKSVKYAKPVQHADIALHI